MLSKIHKWIFCYLFNQVISKSHVTTLCIDIAYYSVVDNVGSS